MVTRLFLKTPTPRIKVFLSTFYLYYIIYHTSYINLLLSPAPFRVSFTLSYTSLLVQRPCLPTSPFWSDSTTENYFWPSLPPSLLSVRQWTPSVKVRLLVEPSLVMEGLWTMFRKPWSGLLGLYPSPLPCLPEKCISDDPFVLGPEDRHYCVCVRYLYGY